MLEKHEILTETLKKEFYLFIWLYRVLVLACRVFSCGMWDLVP